MEIPPNFIFNVDIVIYHKNCADGIAGAWPFWRENLVRVQRKELMIEGATHGQLPPDVSNKNVVLVDFCFPRDIIVKMASVASFIVILDHHASPQRDLEGDGKKSLPHNVYALFDMNRSAAEIAWAFVYPEVAHPWFIDIIADRDLWRWDVPSRPYSKDVSTALFKNGYYTWEKFEWLLSNSQTPEAVESLIKKFIEMPRKDTETEKEVVSACKRAVLTELTTPSGEKYRVRLANCISPKLRSEVGNRLSEGCDFAVTWQYDFFLDEWWCSARASADSPIDLSLIASQFYRGGGHKKAAGFTIKDGKNLHTYFKIVEIPDGRLEDAKLLKEHLPPESTDG
jgi:oligoribonuclease NrnB/cAMP/cGMP phosphodiesterase (DHH superfamily)